MYRKAVFVASCLALLLAAAPAQAGEPFTVGNSGQGTSASPHGAVNPVSGTLTVAWVARSGDNDNVQVCRVLRGARACSAPPQILLPPDGNAGTPYVLINGTNTYVVLQRFAPVNDVQVWTSLSGGPFNGPVKRAEGCFACTKGLISSEPVIDTGGGTATLGLGSTENGGAQNFPLTGGNFATGQADLAGGFGVASPAIGLSGNSPVYAGTKVAPAGSQDQVGFNRYDGSGPINDSSNWGPGTVVGAGTESRLASGPSGLFLFMNAYRGPGSGQPDQFQVRKYTGTTFGAPVNVGGIADDQRNPDLNQTNDGELLVAWGASRGFDQGDTLRLSQSINAGASFSEPVDIVRGEVGSLSFQELDVAAADDGQGFAVWESDESAAIAIRVASLEPAPPLPPPSVPPGPDTTNPTITNPSIGDSTLLPGQGTTFSFISSEGGSAKLVFQKRVKGLKLKEGTKLKCFVSSKKRLRKLRKLLAKQAAVKKLRGKARKRKLAKLVKKRGCKPFKTIGSITQVVTPGRNEIVFTGRVAGRKLAPGVYRATLTVRDLAGNLSSGRVFKFRVMKAR